MAQHRIAADPSAATTYSIETTTDVPNPYSTLCAVETHRPRLDEQANDALEKTTAIILPLAGPGQFPSHRGDAGAGI